ncbi:MAG: DEAD/DEAH box helicase, partial [Candidatus Heimdallarchaeaceae archaeon]
VIKPVKGDFISNNIVQNQAIQKILGTENYLLIQGPAGTGKTHVIAKSAIILANKGERVLLTAFTNRAVDNMCQYLLSNGWKDFIRLGSPHSIQPEIRDYTLNKVQEKYLSKSIKEILRHTPIIVATTSTISSPIFENIGTQTIIIDEASQMTEPTVLSALLEGDKFILVGDHKQLPPVVQGVVSKKKGLDISLFERLAQLHPESVHLLTDQFRMNEKLMEFSNKRFYEGKLKCFDNLTALQNLLDLPNFTADYHEFSHQEIYNPKNPLVYVQVNGQFNPEKKVNKKEAKVVGRVAGNFLKAGISIEQMGIIAPYRGQVGEIRRYVPGVTVDTVDRFQGSDKEIIILSLTETGTKGYKGFSDERRLNVAITRAKKKLVVVGDPEQSTGILKEYVEYLKRNVKNIVLEKQLIKAKPITQQ